MAKNMEAQFHCRYHIVSLYCQFRQWCPQILQNRSLNCKLSLILILEGSYNWFDRLPTQNRFPYCIREDSTKHQGKQQQHSKNGFACNHILMGIYQTKYELLKEYATKKKNGPWEKWIWLAFLVTDDAMFHWLRTDKGVEEAHKGRGWTRFSKISHSPKYATDSINHLASICCARIEELWTLIVDEVNYKLHPSTCHCCSCALPRGKTTACWETALPWFYTPTHT